MLKHGSLPSAAQAAWLVEILEYRLEIRDPQKLKNFKALIISTHCENYREVWLITLVGEAKVLYLSGLP